MKLLLTTALSAGMMMIGALPAWAASDETNTETGEAARTVGTKVGRTTESVVNFLGRKGVGVEAGVGISSFLDHTSAGAASPAGLYTARVLVGTRENVGYELAYNGSLQNITALGLDEKAILVSNGIEGLARYNFLAGELQPYVVGGVGWRHYSLTNESFNTSSVESSDDVLEIPLGGGVAYYFDNGFLLDGRVAYNIATGEDLLGSGDGPGLDTWNTTIKAGWAF